VLPSASITIRIVHSNAPAPEARKTLAQCVSAGIRRRNKTSAVGAADLRFVEGTTCPPIAHRRPQTFHVQPTLPKPPAPLPPHLNRPLIPRHLQISHAQNARASPRPLNRNGSFPITRRQPAFAR